MPAITLAADLAGLRGRRRVLRAARAEGRAAAGRAVRGRDAQRCRVRGARRGGAARSGRRARCARCSRAGSGSRSRASSASGCCSRSRPACCRWCRSSRASSSAPGSPSPRRRASCSRPSTCSAWRSPTRWRESRPGCPARCSRRRCRTPGCWARSPRYSSRSRCRCSASTSCSCRWRCRAGSPTRATASTAGTRAGVFVMGVLSALIVGPCVAAPLAGALLYISQSRDVVLGGSALFAMALGMGVPLLAVGASAGALLPKAGPWMETVKRFFGVLLLGVAIYLVSPFIAARGADVPVGGAADRDRDLPARDRSAARRRARLPALRQGRRRHRAGRGHRLPGRRALGQPRHPAAAVGPARHGCRRRRRTRRRSSASTAWPSSMPASAPPRASR